MPSTNERPQSALSKAIRQSPPVDLSVSYDPAWVKNKTILITGGASGFGAGFVKHWAKHGANIIVGDINTEKADALVRELRIETGNSNLHFVYCDVTDWQSQVNLFKEAARLSPHGGIDTVVANAGIAGQDLLQFPTDLSVAEPKQPNFRVMDVNCTGVIYTTHLAHFWLPRNPGSQDSSVDSQPANSRDRHLLLLGSMASISPIPIQPQYGAAKHAVLGLFRSLRATSHIQGIRINLLMPYFIDTPIVTSTARMLLAGGSIGRVEDVVDAATRFVADSRILGRALCIGPNVNVKQKEDGEWILVEKDTPGGKKTAIWEAYSDDWEEVDAFCRNIAKLLNALQTSRGWIGWATDMVKAIGYSLGLGRR